MRTPTEDGPVGKTRSRILASVSGSRVRSMLVSLSVLVVAALAVVAWMWPASRPSFHPAVIEGGDIVLPSPRTVDDLSVAEALARRRSHREFADKELSIEQLGQLCWAAQGITDHESGLRTAPSAGALFPLTVFVVDARGVYEYQPERHLLRCHFVGDIRKKLQAAALDQTCVGSAPACLIIAMDAGRTASKYGNRAERYCLLEAGHVAQNILLQATALELVSVPVGAFTDGELVGVLRLPSNLRPVYLLPVGYPGR
jgi:SagB-type dehydrogenase family enzyme